MGRWLILVLMLALVAAPPLIGTAQDATPLATPAATPAAVPQLDLAALTLRPADLEAIGLENFGLANQSSLRDAATDAILQSEGDAIEVTERLHDYRMTGFQYRYLGSLLSPQVPLVRLPSGLLAADQRISTSVALYATAEGAATSFAFMNGALYDPSSREVSGAKIVGDESKLIRSSGFELETNNPLQRLKLAFRHGNLIGEVAIIDYENVEPEIETIELLAEVLLARITRPRDEGGPNLGYRVLRIDPHVTWIERSRLRDFYVRLDNTDQPTFAIVLATIRKERDLSPTPAPESAEGHVLPRATYMFWTPIGEGNPFDLPLYVTWLDLYDTPQHAAAALEAVTTDLGPGYVRVREFTQADERIGTASRAFTYRYQGDRSGTVRGHVVIVQVDDAVIRVQVDGPDGIRRPGVTALAERQVACLEMVAPCAPLPVHQAEAELLIPAATPVPTP